MEEVSVTTDGTWPGPNAADSTNLSDIISQKEPNARGFVKCSSTKVKHNLCNNNALPP